MIEMICEGNLALQRPEYYDYSVYEEINAKETEKHEELKRKIAVNVLAVSGLILMAIMPPAGAAVLLAASKCMK